MTGEAVLSVEGLEIDLDLPTGTIHAVSGVDFSVRQGETLCIVGESGCGKTMTALSLIRLLPKIASLKARRIALAGQDLTTLSDAAFARLRGNRISMIFQDPMTALNPVYTIGNQLVEGFVRHGKGSRAEGRERALHLLDRVGIPNPSERLRQYPHQLSGGLRQRVMIAMALICDPLLLIADEPTTALDVTTQAKTLDLLRGLQDEFGTAIVFITHDLGVVARVADSVSVMYAGKVVETGNAREILGAPLHPYTRGLMACLPGANSPTGLLGTIPGRVPSLMGRHAGCLFRNRCNLTIPICAGRDIAMLSTSDGHAYRCVHGPQELVGA